MFDPFLLDWSRRTGEPFRPFEVPADYAAYVDGKLRQDGVRSFLTSRAIALDEGSPDDLPSTETVHGLGTRKNDLVLDLIRHGGIEVYPASVRFVEVVRAAGLRRAVVSAVFEHAIAGVQAGRAGAFGWVFGVDRVGQADALRRHGADRVVTDLGELLPR